MRPILAGTTPPFRLIPEERWGEPINFIAFTIRTRRQGCGADTRTRAAHHNCPSADAGKTLLIFELMGWSVPGLGGARAGVYAALVPIFHECQRCTACCRWPGQVRVTDAELSRLAAFKNMSEHDFIQRFMRLRPDRQGLALLDQADGACIFLDGNECTVQPVKPQQCRDFPNLWNFRGFEKVCRAIPHIVSGQEYRRRVAVTTGRALGSISIPE